MRIYSVQQGALAGHAQEACPSCLGCEGGPWLQDRLHHHRWGLLLSCLAAPGTTRQPQACCSQHCPGEELPSPPPMPGSPLKDCLLSSVALVCTRSSSSCMASILAVDAALQACRP